MQGSLLCARCLFSPQGEKDAERLYQFVVAKDDDTFVKEIIKKYPVYSLLRLISAKNKADPFNLKVVEAYWIGNEFLDNITTDDLGLILKSYGRFSSHIDKLLFLNAKLGATERLPAHHAVFVMLQTLDITDVIPHLPQINASLIRWGTVHAVYPDSVLMHTACLARDEKYALREQEETIPYDVAFAGGIKIGDTLALHHGMAIFPLSLLQLAFLKRCTEKTITVFNTL